MVKFAVGFLLAMVYVLLVEISAKNPDDDWKDWKTKYNKQYRDKDEEKERKKIFLETRVRVNKHNSKQGLKYKMKFTEFADKNENQRKYFLGAIPPKDLPAQVSKRSVHEHIHRRQVVPDGVDLRTEGLVSPVKYQGLCNSCWAFTTVATLESFYLRYTGQSLSFSEQNLIDCDNANFGCGGGFYAYDYVKDSGIALDTAYEYTKEDGNCITSYYMKNLGNLNFVPIDEWYYHYSDDPAAAEERLKSYIADYGAVSVSLQVTNDLYDYGQGIFVDYNNVCKNGPFDVNHGVVAVGYGVEEDTPYWIFKNSWGTFWGEDGFFRMLRDGSNLCSIGSWPTYLEDMS